MTIVIGGRAQHCKMQDANSIRHLGNSKILDLIGFNTMLIFSDILDISMWSPKNFMLGMMILAFGAWWAGGWIPSGKNGINIINILRYCPSISR